MTENVFEIATEDGKKFCMCDNSGAAPVLIGKEGRIDLNDLIHQAHDRNYARKMRREKKRVRKP